MTHDSLLMYSPLATNLTSYNYDIVYYSYTHTTCTYIAITFSPIKLPCNGTLNLQHMHSHVQVAAKIYTI